MALYVKNLTCAGSEVRGDLFMEVHIFAIYQWRCSDMHTRVFLVAG